LWVVVVGVLYDTFSVGGTHEAAFFVSNACWRIAKF